MIAVGTCGFSYKDWVGPVYPPRTKPADMLGEYARRFSVVEIDSSYYRVPSLATFASLSGRTPDRFRFAVKLPASATHLPLAVGQEMHEDVPLFRRNLQPLLDDGKLLCALMQFPNSFRPSKETHRHIGALREALEDIALVAEFRNREWQANDTLTLLHELRIGLVNVDQPQFKSLLRPASDVTSDIAYVRFHGRNYQQWWKGTNETRYDYSYSAEELGPWADRIVDLAANPDVKEVLGFFNNHRRGQAVKNAEMFEEMLAMRFPRDLLRKPLPQNDGTVEPVQIALELDGCDSDPH